MATGTPDSSSPANQAGQPPLPSTVGRFQILTLLGSGGMGVVYQAHDPKKDRIVALKVLARDKATNPTMLQRFRSEALATRHLRHENIVGVFEAGIVDGQFYIALEYVDGIDIAQLVQSRGHLPVPHSVDIIRQVTEALHHAFQQGIVHRDIKPSNLLIRRDGAVKLSDMGLARSTEDDEQSGITRAGTTVGTVDYIAPEQARDSKAADVRSDIYSLGCTWYHMLTGEAPYPEGTLTQKLKHHGSTPAPDPRMFNEDIHEDVVHVMARMLAKRPDQRFQSPTELLQALAEIDLDRSDVSHGDLAGLAEEDLSKTVPPAAHSKPAATSSPKTTEPITGRPLTPETLADAPDERENSPDPKVETTTPKRDPKPRSTPATAPEATATPSTDEPHWTTPDSLQPELPPASHESRRPARHRPPPARRSAGGINWRKLAPLGLMLLGISALLGLIWILRSLGMSMEAPASADKETPFVNDSGGQQQAPSSRQGAGSGLPSSGTETEFQRTREPVAPRIEHVLCPQPVLRPGEARVLPDWVLRPPDQDLPVLEVGGSGPHHYDRLDEALAAIPSAGALVRLNGPGPFFLSPTQLENKAHVVIAPDTGRSLLVLRGESPDSTSRLAVLGGSLRLERIDLVSQDGQPQSAGHLSLIALSSSNLSLHNCSITQMTRRQGEATAISVSGTPDSHPARVLLDRVFLRGFLSTVIEASSHGIDLALVNSLLVNGSGPALSLAVAPPQGSATAVDRSFVRVISTTLSSHDALLQLRTTGSAAARPVQVELVNSILTGLNPKRAILLDLGNWPQRDDPGRDESRFLGLDWRTTSSLVYGCRDLVHLDAAVGSSIRTPDEWQQCWPTTDDETTFQPSRWPTSTDSQPVISLRPALFDTRALKNPPVMTTSGETPGCPVSALPAPSASLGERSIGLSRRPAHIGAFPTSSADVRIKLKDHPDLGKYLADHPPDNRTRLTVIGQGRHFTSPLRIENQTLQIVFQDGKGDPLVLVAQGIAAGSSAGDADELSLFTVSQGHLLLHGGRFELAAQSDQTPRRFLSVSDGSFVLENCSVVDDSRMTDADSLGLIKWLTTSTPIPQPTSRIDSSFLASRGTLLQADMSRRHLLIRDSLLVSRDRLFELRTAPGETNAVSSLEIHRSTLAATRTLISVKTPDSPTGPLDMFIEETIFAPGNVTADVPGTTLLACPAQAVRTALVSWWGRHNGFSPHLGPYLRDITSEGRSIRAGKRPAFDRQWGTAHRLAPLHGPRGVAYKESANSQQPVSPLIFRLVKRCRAKRWGPGQSAIGADVEFLARQLGDMPTSPATSTGGPNF